MRIEGSNRADGSGLCPLAAARHSGGMRIGYVRVSDNEQNEQLQIDALNAAGCDIVFGDHGVSGAVPHRKGLKEVLASLQAGDTLIVWKIDRLSRSTVHLLLLLDELHQRDISFISVTQGIDTTTPIGRLIFGQLALFAEFEREQIRERTCAGMAAARKRGQHVGRPYKLTGAQVAEAARRLESDETSITKLARGFGVSVSTLSRALRRMENLYA